MAKNDGPVLSSYVAKQCPVRVRLDVLEPVERADPSPALQLRGDRGRAFEAEIAAQLAAERGGRGWRFAAEAEMGAAGLAGWTTDAMDAGSELIVGGQLPTDEEGGRSGKPDVLVRFGAEPVDGRWRYLPVDVKHHRTVETADKPASTPVQASTLAAPALEARSDLGETVGLRRRLEDVSQLAHYVRMLQACGHDADTSYAGIIGVERQVTWHDLGAKLYRTPTADPEANSKMRSAFERYDFEFDFRQRIAEAATRPDRNVAAGLLVEPMRCAECSDCPWRNHCDPVIEVGHGDASLLPGVGYPAWRLLRDNGIRTRQDVIDKIDKDTAVLLADKHVGAKIAWLYEQATASSDPSEPVEVLFNGKTKALAALRNHKYTTLGDVSSLHADTLNLGKGQWANYRRDAEAALSPEPHLPTGNSKQQPPRFDIEVDVDMENSVDEHVYLWGAIVTENHTGQSAYHHFENWQTDSVEDERALFAVDDVVDSFDLVMGSLLARVDRLGQRERLRSLGAFDQAALTLREVCLILLDPAIDDTELRRTVFAQLPEPELERAAETIGTLASRPGDHHFADLLSRYSHIRRFQPLLAELVEFERSTGGDDALEALRYLVAAEDAKRLDPAKAPMAVVSPAWAPHVAPNAGVINRKAYTFCVLEALHVALRRRRCWPEHGQVVRRKSRNRKEWLLSDSIGTQGEMGRNISAIYLPDPNTESSAQPTAGLFAVTNYFVFDRNPGAKSFPIEIMFEIDLSLAQYVQMGFIPPISEPTGLVVGGLEPVSCPIDLVAVTAMQNVPKS